MTMNIEKHSTSSCLQDPDDDLENGKVKVLESNTLIEPKVIDSNSPEQNICNGLSSESFWNKYKGYASPLVAFVLICIAAATSVLSKTIVKLLFDVGPFTISATRFAVVFLISFPIVIYRREPIFPTGKRTWLLVRSIIGSLNNGINYFAVKHMPIGDQTMVAASATFFACIYARIFLKEQIKVLNLVNIVFVISGVLLIAKPPFIFGGDENDIYSEDPLAVYAVSILIAQNFLLYPNIFIALRALKDLHWSTILSVFGCIGFFSTFTAAVIIDGEMASKHIFPTSAKDWGMLIGNGLLSFVVQVCFTKAHQFEKASTISLERKATDVIFAFLFQIIIFMDIPTAYSGGGAALIFVALVVSSISKICNERSENKKKMEKDENQ